MNKNNAETVYVLLEPSGTRLGNWMFQYAAARTAAPEAKIAFLVRNRAEWPDVERRRELFPDVPIVDCAPEGATIRKGLFQDAKFISREIVKECYRCPARVEAYLEKTYGELLRRENLVSIHVRRGDYLGLPHRHPFVGEAYLKKAVAEVCKRIGERGREDSGQKTKDRGRGQGNVGQATAGERSGAGKPVFIVCSDDLPWCRAFFSAANFPGLEFHFAADDGGVMGDLFLMTKCRHHICSNSTFSWWGAYIGVANCESRDNSRARVGQKTEDNGQRPEDKRQETSDGVDPITIFPSLWFGLQLRREQWQGFYFEGSTVIKNAYRPKMLAHALALMAKNTCGDILRALHLRKRRSEG